MTQTQTQTQTMATQTTERCKPLFVASSYPLQDYIALVQFKQVYPDVDTMYVIANSKKTASYIGCMKQLFNKMVVLTCKSYLAPVTCNRNLQKKTTSSDPRKAEKQLEDAFRFAKRYCRSLLYVSNMGKHHVYTFTSCSKVTSNSLGLMTQEHGKHHMALEFTNVSLVCSIEGLKTAFCSPSLFVGSKFRIANRYCRVVKEALRNLPPSKALARLYFPRQVNIQHSCMQDFISHVLLNPSHWFAVTIESTANYSDMLIAVALLDKQDHHRIPPLCLAGYQERPREVVPATYDYYPGEYRPEDEARPEQETAELAQGQQHELQQPRLDTRAIQSCLFTKNVKRYGALPLLVTSTDQVYCQALYFKLKRGPAHYRCADMSGRRDPLDWLLLYRSKSQGCSRCIFDNVDIAKSREWLTHESVWKTSIQADRTPKSERQLYIRDRAWDSVAKALLEKKKSCRMTCYGFCSYLTKAMPNLSQKKYSLTMEDNDVALDPSMWTESRNGLQSFSKEDQQPLFAGMTASKKLDPFIVYVSKEKRGNSIASPSGGYVNTKNPSSTHTATGLCSCSAGSCSCSQQPLTSDPVPTGLCYDIWYVPMYMVDLTLDLMLEKSECGTYPNLPLDLFPKAHGKELSGQVSALHSAEGRLPSKDDLYDMEDSNSIMEYLKQCVYAMSYFINFIEQVPRINGPYNKDPAALAMQDMKRYLMNY